MCVCVSTHNSILQNDLWGWMQWWRQNESIIYGCENKEASHLNDLDMQEFISCLCWMWWAVAWPLVSSHYRMTQAMGPYGTCLSGGREKVHTKTLKTLAWYWPWATSYLPLIQASQMTKPDVQVPGKQNTKGTLNVKWWRSGTALPERGKVTSRGQP